MFAFGTSPGAPVHITRFYMVSMSTVEAIDLKLILTKPHVYVRLTLAPLNTERIDSAEPVTSFPLS